MCGVRIKCIEIRNFRKLADVRLDLSEKTTLLVGANNSGKTSVLDALHLFLVDGAGSFNVNDITLANWQTINETGSSWIQETEGESDITAPLWQDLFPTLDVWLHVENRELYQVSSLLPNLNWAGGTLGVRIALEPKRLEDLYRDFRRAWQSSDKLRHLGAQDGTAENPQVATSAQEANDQLTLRLWPETLVDFLTRRLRDYLTLNYYVLDPSTTVSPPEGHLRSKSLGMDPVPLEANPLRQLIRLNIISAQRAVGEERNPLKVSSSRTVLAQGSELSRQLRDYYERHLNPLDLPDKSDLKALSTIAAAEREFDRRLGEGFRGPLAEVQNLGYPGVSDPTIRVATRLSAAESLNHESAVSFVVDAATTEASPRQDLQLPEGRNGLGYQNLISMVFKLMSFRDAWMKVGKAGTNRDSSIEPLHLVLVEEPEAHLHVQVQQVFAKKAFEILRNHPDLGENQELVTQLVMSTHSSHISHQLPFADLRHFRRLPAGIQKFVSTSTISNLAEVFGPKNETRDFVTRYLRTFHADLFFADAVILVEGAAERILLPNFIRGRHGFLNGAYMSILEIGGSHAHRMRPLIEILQIPTLVITDIDARKDGKSSRVKRGESQVTGNPTLKDWLGVGADIDGLLDLSDDKKVRQQDDLFAVRFAYQIPVKVSLPGDAEPGEALPSTFEDALALENIEFFAELEGNGLTRRFRESLSGDRGLAEVAELLFTGLKDGGKAALALDVLTAESFCGIRVPSYIKSGLDWLETRLRKQVGGSSDGNA